MTAIPCGAKKSSREMIQSQMVTPPLAAMDGTTFKLNTATTNSSTRSRWPRTRLRCGWDSAVFTSSVNVSLRKLSAESPLCAAGNDRFLTRSAVLLEPGSESRRRLRSSVGRCGGDQTALGLSLCQSGRDLVEHGQVGVDVRFAVLHRDGPLLVPPIGLRQHAAVHHREPIVAPEVDIDLGPVAVVLDLLRIEHERAVHSGARDIGFQSDFLDDRTIAVGELPAELVDQRIVFAGKDFAEGCEPGSHCDTVGVVGAAVKDLVVGD